MMGAATCSARVTPAALRRKSRRVRARAGAKSRDRDASNARRPAFRSCAGKHHVSLPMRNGDAHAHGFAGCVLFLRVHELANVGDLLVEIRQMLRPQLLIDLKLFLRFFFLTGVHVRLRQPVVSIGEIGIARPKPVSYSGIDSAYLRLIRVQDCPTANVPPRVWDRA